MFGGSELRPASEVSAEVKSYSPERVRGRFAPGHSGNPGGKAKASRQVVQLAREMSEAVLRSLYRIATKGRSESARVAAAQVILDRAFGRPKVSVDLESDGPMFTAIRQIIVSPRGRPSARPSSGMASRATSRWSSDL
jgi:hypothetical protein